MKATLVRMMAGILAVIVLSAPAMLPAQESLTPPPPPAQEAPQLSQAQLDQLLAPIALYPDTLLSQILMASTYPLEVVEASRWVQDPNNAKLAGQQLTDALDQQDWDPSVKSLAPFPQILKMMDDNLRWTQQLGDAFLSQQDDVMDSVQRLRAQAQTAGTLKSTPQQSVTADGSTIIIEPASPEVVYVPYYSPAYVYAPWPYPDYPPYYFPPPYGYYGVEPGIYFGIGVGIITAFWGWDYWDWHHHRIHIDHDRYNRINRYAIDHWNRPRFTGDAWDHDPYHRRGVPYRDPGTRTRYLGVGPTPPDARRDFRGYPATGAAGIPAPGGQPVVGPRITSPATQPPAATTQPPIGPRVPQTVTPPPAATTQPPIGPRVPRAVTPPAATTQPPIGPRVPQAVTPPPAATTIPPIGPRVPTPATRQPLMIQQPQPPAFEGMTRAPEVQRQIERAQQSRQYLPRSMQDRSVSPRAPPAATMRSAPATGAAGIPAPGGQPVVGPRTAPAGSSGKNRR